MQDHFPVKANARPFSGEGVRFKSCGVPPPQEERRYILNVPKNHYRRYARKNPDCGYGIIIIFTIIHHPISGGVLVGAGTKGRSFWKKISGRQRFANFAERVVDAVEPGGPRFVLSREAMLDGNAARDSHGGDIVRFEKGSGARDHQGRPSSLCTTSFPILGGRRDVCTTSFPIPGGPPCAPPAPRRRSVEITRRASPRGGTPIPH